MIQKLSHALISQIAAGEVIERPASALKELIENSLDAQATQLLIEWDHGGLSRLRVKDNGHGIEKQDLLMSVERHATSKLHCLEDLNRLDSLGFRGEALASIASIASLHMKTRHRNEALGQELLVDGSKVIFQKPMALAEGTDILIQDLFKHTPARRKTMKSEKHESEACLKLIERYAMLHHPIGFQVFKDGELLLDLEPSADPLWRLEELFGKQTREALIPVQSFHQAVRIRGFIGKPELSKSSAKQSYLFVNDRPIEDSSVHYAVKHAYQSLLMHEKNPWYFLDIQIQGDLVDVNVHPRKKEVKFVNAQEVFRLVHGMVRHALEHQDLHLGAKISPLTQELHPARIQDKSDFLEKPYAENTSLFDPSHAHGETLERPLEDFVYLGQVHHSYLLVQSLQGLQLIDQHALHERILYEKYKKNLAEKRFAMQKLLEPLVMSLSPSEKIVLDRVHDALTDLGLHYEWFSDRSIILREIPHDLLKQNFETLFKDWLHSLADHQHSPIEEVRQAWITLRACKDAIKFGQKISAESAIQLLKDRELAQHSSHCPHGRPSWIEWSLDDLEKLFKRKNF